MMEINTIVNDRFVIKLVTHKIDVNEAIANVSSAKCGAISLFMGTTRDTETGETHRKLSNLYYEAYNQMALKEMTKIVEQKLFKSETDTIHKCFIVHRLGCVAVGETSILIACSSTHRNEAHDMVMKLLNEIKAKVPIWKKINFIDSNSDSSKSSEWSDKSEAFWLNK